MLDRFVLGVAVLGVCACVYLAASTSIGSVPFSSRVQPTPIAPPTSAPTPLPTPILRVRVILAVPASPPFMDPRLSSLAPYLSRHKKFGFSLLADHQTGFVVGTPNRFSLPSGTLDLTVTKLDAQSASIRTLLRNHGGESVLDSKVRSGPYKPFFIAGPKTLQGDLLFLALEWW